MNDYMRALHQRFFREPECKEQKQEIETNRQKLQKRLLKSERRVLLRILDAESLMQEEVSLASFTAGFRLAAGIARELETEGFIQNDEQEV